MPPHAGVVKLLSGRLRPLKGISSADPKVSRESERKAVNTSVQGFAADLIKVVMLWRATMCAGYLRFGVS